MSVTVTYCRYLNPPKAEPLLIEVILLIYIEQVVQDSSI
jgi:hypothetical protein